MGILGINYNRPGPGVSKNEPQKKGIKRFAELFLREFSSLIKLNLFFCLFAVPSAALFVLGFFGTWGVPALILSIPAAFPLGGAVTACMYCVTKMLRDDPGYIFYEFKRKFKENIIQAALPGIIYTAFTFIQLYAWIGMILGLIKVSFGTAAILIISAIFFEMTIPYVFLQTAYLELKNSSILQNSVILAIKNAPKSFCGMLLGHAGWITSFLLFPLSLWWTPLLLLFGFSLSWLVNTMWIWPAIDKVFCIEESLRAMREQKTDGIETIFKAVEPSGTQIV